MWEGKPYYSLDAYLKGKFHKKIQKLSIDGGFGCPNRDGTLSTNGCSFCSGRGSGDFTGPHGLSVTEQLSYAQSLLSLKWSGCGSIAYFQAFTNTYAPVEELERKYEEALAFPNICGLAIATRPDCVDDDVLNLLTKMNEKTFLWVELGLQTIQEKTARAINRGYSLSCFEHCLEKLRSRGIETVVHTIMGLPGETKEEMLETITYLSQKPIQGIKIQLLHILKNTPLAEQYKKEPFALLSKEEYVFLVCKAIALLRPDIIIHRLTGDGPKESLIAPLWSTNKRDVLNSIHKELKKNGIFQGMDIIS